ncbi:hypothetical protein LEP3755_42920 [Leptolyngbya sp. NIES-3755]|nr:hypothetical protein LEP3755_42920 [Leptolyngbya sp. NIES-3755]
MSDTLESNNEPDSINDMRMRCHRLIDAIAKRPGSAKLLQLAEKALILYSEYKTNRKR